SQLLGFSASETVGDVQRTTEGLDINKKSDSFSPYETTAWLFGERDQRKSLQGKSESMICHREIS
ncbi:MAG: hypothetical protein ABFR02_07915, partial [Campylobacterota bacterium]